MANGRNNSTTIKKPYFTKVRIAMLIIVAVFLLLAQSAFWVQRNFFNNSRFSAITSEALTTQSSRDAISQEIVSQALGNRPVLNKLAGNTASNLIASLLGTNAAGNVLELLGSKIQSVVTSNHHKSIIINLTSLKNIIAKLVALSENTNANISIDPSQIPNQIVLVNKDSIPSFYTYGLVVLWVGWACFIAAIALVSWLIYKSRTYVSPMIVACGVSLIGSSILGLIIGPLIRPSIASLGSSLNMQTLIGNIYDAFLAPFNHQMYVMLIIGAVAVIAGFVTTKWFRAKFVVLTHRTAK